MALRNIVTVGDSVLSKTCRPVVKFDRRLHILIDDMIDTLIDSGGVGLAAPQVGVLRRVVVVDVGDNEILELINPEIVEQSGEQTGLEGSAKCIGGCTYAKMLPNILAFGPIFPGDEVREHKPDEYISIENLMKNTQIYAHAMYAMAK